MRQYLRDHAGLLSSAIKAAGAEVAAVEAALHLVIPGFVRDLLCDYGYSDYCGIPNLVECIDLTLRARSALDLPPEYLVLEDKGDGGLVVLDTSSECASVYWGDYMDFPNAMHDADIYPTYREYIDELIATETGS